MTASLRKGWRPPIVEASLGLQIKAAAKGGASAEVYRSGCACRKHDVCGGRGERQAAGVARGRDERPSAGGRVGKRPPSQALLASQGAVRCASAPTWAACRGEHPRVLHGVTARRRDAGRKPTQQRERIHVHRDRPVGKGALERQPHQAVLLHRDALLRARRPQDDAQQRLPRRGMVRTGTCRRVQGKAIQRGAQRLVVRERARQKRREPTEPLRCDEVWRGSRRERCRERQCTSACSLALRRALLSRRTPPRVHSGVSLPSLRNQRLAVPAQRLGAATPAPRRACPAGRATRSGIRWRAPRRCWYCRPEVLVRRARSAGALPRPAVRLPRALVPPPRRTGLAAPRC
jgi:hypothetical protein